MTTWLAFTIVGLYTGAAYAIAASGVVLTYTTTRVFNVGHGAVAMIMSFVYWQLHVKEHLATGWSLVLVLLVIAPLFGTVVQFAMRGLGDAPVGVSLVVTVGLFVLLVGVATKVWPPAPRTVNPFFGLDKVQVGDGFVSYHQLITIGVSALVAGGLYVLLNLTRLGTAMRAAVDNPELLQLFGGRPVMISIVSWAVGSSLAALAGILLVSEVGLDYYNLTFLVIDAFAAAMIGRLKSLPMTFAGAMAMGLLQSYAQGYLPSTQFVSDFRDAIPVLLLFVVLVFVPQARLRVGQIKGIVSAPVPSVNRALESAVGLIALGAIIVPMLSTTNVQRGGLMLGYALVMLSLVLLTGYGGHVSMAQMAFMGIGAATVAKMNTTSPLAIVAAVLISAAVGALVALPVLRLTGLYLALATLAFGELMDQLVFQSSLTFKYGGSLNAKRMNLLGYQFGSASSYLILMIVVFAVLSVGLVLVRRGPIGRVLLAMRDSPAACGTLGLNLRWSRVVLFSVSAGIAGLGGALVAGLRGTVAASDFQTFNSLVLLLFAVVFGVTSMTGALAGGFGFMILPVLQSQFPSLAGVFFVIIGAGAVWLGRDPNGLVNLAFSSGRFGAGLLRRAEPRRPRHEIVDHGEPVGAGLEGREQVAGHGVA